MINYTFTADANGDQPYASRESTPIFKVEVCDSVYTVASEGIGFKVYTNSGMTGTPSIDGNVSHIMQYWGEGTPIGITETDTFSVVYSGYFHPPEDGTYYFNFAGAGSIKFYFAKAGSLEQTYLEAPNDMNATLDWVELANQKGFTFTTTKNSFNNTGFVLNASSTYAFRLEFKKTNTISGVTALFSNNASHREPLPISAGVATKNGAMKAWHTLEDIDELQINIAENEIQTLQFTVPFSASTESDGYHYNSSDDSYVLNSDSSGNKKLKFRRLIRASIGYRTNGTDEYVTRFTGNITNLPAPRSLGNGDKINVKAQSFLRFAKETILVNEPTELGYWVSGYLMSSSMASPPAGDIKPRCFDRWHMSKVAKYLYLLSGIDSLLLAKQSNEGSLISNNNIILESNRKYGNPETHGAGADSKYIWAVSTGEMAFDVLKKLAQNHGYSIYDNGYYSGAPAVSSQASTYYFIDPKWLVNRVLPPGDSFEPTYPSWWTFGSRNASEYSSGGESVLGSSYSVTPKSGSHVWKCANAYDGVKFSSDWIFIKKGAYYTFSFYALSAYHNRLQLFIQTPYQETDYNHPWNGEMFGSLSGDNAWHKFSKTLQASADEYIRPRVEIIDNMSGIMSFVYLDDFALHMNNTEQSHRSWADSNWHIVSAPRAIGGAIIEAQQDSSSDYLEIEFQGSKFDIITVVGSGYGTMSYELLDSSRSTVISETTVSLNTSTSTYYYYDGVDSSGSNPTVISITNDDSGSTLTRGYYYLRLRARDSSKKVGINAIKVYETTEKTVSSTTFYTGDYSGNVGTIKNLTVSNATDDFRNDVLVIGNRRGAVMADPSRTDSTPINPNNPIYNYVYARSINIDSIYSPSANNYVGKPIQTIIVEPSIGSNERASWLADEFISRYSENINKMIEFDAIGNPLIEPNDRISLVDVYKNTVTASDSLWVKKIQLTWSRSTTNGHYSLSPFEPLTPYVPKPISVIYQASDAVTDITIKNGDGTTNSESNAYDPYDSDNGKYLTFTFNLSVDADVKIRIVEANSGYEEDVAYLLDQQNESDGWKRLEQGQHTYIWDGTDFFGKYNEKIVYNGHAIGKQFWVNNWTGQGNAKFYLIFNIMDINTLEIYEINTASSSQYFYTSLGSNTEFEVTTLPSAINTDSKYDRVANVPPYFYIKGMSDDDSHNLRFVIKPKTNGRKIFSISSDKIAFDSITLRVDYAGGVVSSPQALMERRETIFKKVFTTSSIDQYVLSISDGLMKDKEVVNQLSYSNFRKYIPSIDNWNPEKRGWLWDWYNSKLNSSRSEYWIAWLLFIKINVSDKSGRVVQFTRYYPWRDKSDTGNWSTFTHGHEKAEGKFITYADQDGNLIMFKNEYNNDLIAARFSKVFTKTW